MSSNLPHAPQSAGDIVGQGVRMCRYNLPLIFKTLLAPSILTMIGGIMINWVLNSGLGFADLKDSEKGAMAITLFCVGITAFIVWGLAWWFLGLRILALVRFFLGFAPSMAEAKTYMTRRKWAVFGVYFIGVIIAMFALVGCIMLGVMIAFIAPASMSTAHSASVAFGIAFGTAGALIVLSIYALASHLSFCLLACEDQPVMTVVGRSVQLVCRYLWRAIAFGLVFMLTFMVVVSPLTAPLGILTIIDYAQQSIGKGAAAAASFKPSLWMMIISQAWETAIGVFVRPLVVLCFGLFYYDLRLRNDGLDISRKLQSLAPRETGA